MVTLKENLQEIKRQKDTYIKPENLKKGITIFGITGELEISNINKLNEALHTIVPDTNTDIYEIYSFKENDLVFPDNITLADPQYGSTLSGNADDIIDAGILYKDTNIYQYFIINWAYYLDKMLNFNASTPDGVVYRTTNFSWYGNGKSSIWIATTNDLNNTLSSYNNITALTLQEVSM